MTDKEKEYNDLLKFILNHGESMPKKHGAWIILRLSLIHDGDFFQLDSWNGSIVLKSGSGKYNYWTGFEGVTKIKIGSKWGKFESELSVNTIRAYYNRALNWVSYLKDLQTE